MEKAGQVQILIKRCDNSTEYDVASRILWSSPLASPKKVTETSIRCTAEALENWLAKEDFNTPQVLTIVHAETRDMPDGKRKPCLFFKETGMVKAMGLNKTNLGVLNRLFGSDEGDDWVGQRVEVFNDPSVTFQGQVGGLRIRAAPRQVAHRRRPLAPLHAFVGHKRVQRATKRSRLHLRRSRAPPYIIEYARDDYSPASGECPAVAGVSRDST